MILYSNIFAMFSLLIPHIKERLTKHHELYSGKCKDLYWEENCAYALRKAGYGSDWYADENHKPGLDQTTDDGIRVGNKSGKILMKRVIDEKTGKKIKVMDSVGINGSRLTKHKTLDDKLEFLGAKKEDYIFCLATNEKDWKNGIRKYYFMVIDSEKLDYHNHIWEDMIGVKESTKGKHMGWKMTSENFDAKIVKKMSHQLWTSIKLNFCEEIHDIVIG